MKLLNLGDECYVCDSDNVSKYYNSDKSPQLFKVVRAGISFENGIAYQNVELESVSGDSTTENIVFEDNKAVSLTEQGASQPVLNIPYLVNGQIITEISNDFMYNNHTVEKVNIPFTVTKIGNRAFAYTTIEAPLELPNGLKSIGNSAFDSSRISGDLILPEGLTELGSYAFSGNLQLDGIVSIPSTFKFPSGDKSAAGAFYDCKNIRRVEIYSDSADNKDLSSLFDTDDTYPIYVLDEMVNVFHSASPAAMEDRIQSLNTLYE